MSPDNICRQFDENGFVGPLDVLDRSEVSQTLAEFETWFRTDSRWNENKAQSDERYKTHLFLPASNRIVHHPKIVNVVQNLLKTTNILCWSTDWNIKMPDSQHFFAPHQDSTYAGLCPADKVITVWVAISDPVTEKDGCLSFWKGSHLLGQIPHEIKQSRYNMLSLQQQCSPPTWAQTHVPLRAGQATIHNFRTVHTSGPNLSKNQMRVGFAIRYMCASVRQQGPTKEMVTLVSGEPQHDGFLLEPILPHIPSEAELQAGKMAQQEAVRREAENYFSSKVV